MTLPKASKFPNLPEGYRFELEYEGVDWRSRENVYTLWVLNIEDEEDDLVSEMQVIESYVLDSARRLMDLASLIVDERDGDTKVRVGALNQELRLRADRSSK